MPLSKGLCKKCRHKKDCGRSITGGVAVLECGKFRPQRG